MSDYSIRQLPIICASAVAESLTYKKVIDKCGKTWLIANQPNPADNIYVGGPEPDEGFGGRTIEFQIEDGSIVKLQGPWHSNSEALFRATGIDIRDKHKTFGVVARGTDSNILRDVIYQDTEPIIGTFSRVNEIAQELADKMNETLICYVVSAGGSCRGPVKPKRSCDANENEKV